MNGVCALALALVLGLALAPVAGHAEIAVSANDAKMELVNGQARVVQNPSFEWNGTALRDTGQRIKLKGGSAAVRTAEK